MKCKFCDQELAEGMTVCPDCEKKQQDTSAMTETEKLIESMPKIHDELDNIKRMRVREEKRKRLWTGVLISVLVVLVCGFGVWAGFTFFPEFFGKDEAKETNSAVVSSSVPGERTVGVLGAGYTNVLVLDELTAKDAVDSIKANLGITADNTDFALESRRSVGSDTYYRFRQLCFGIDVYDGEIVLAVSKDGTVTAISYSIVGTDGLKDESKLDMGAASNAISEYTNKLTDDYRITAGAVMSNATKSVYNFEGNTYLAYTANVSGYNGNGEYIAYDAFVDANTGGGIHLRVTASYEPEAPAEEAVPTEESTPPAEQNVVNSAKLLSAENAVTEYYTVSDKFNWNDRTKTGALELLEKEYISDGSVSAYITGAKTAVDEAYAYFADRFGYQGLDGQNGAFRVYINPNEYLEDKLPPESALYHNDVLMFVREDLTQGTLNRNVAMHEYAHGVMYHIARPDGTCALTESAAVAEGLADVFGEVAESYFTGNADWIHESRNLATPDSGFLVTLPEKTEILSLTDCYWYSTIVSSAMYRMNQKGVHIDAIGEIAYRTICFMTKGADFSQWRAATEFAAKCMLDTGRLTNEQFDAVISSLAETAIQGGSVAPRQVESLGDEMGEVVPESSETPTEEETIE